MKFIYLLLIGLFITSCKKTNQAKPLESISEEKTLPVDANELTTRLFQNYISNPVALGHFEENKIIDYAIEHNLDLNRSESGLYYLVIRKGTGEKLSRNERIKVDYKGAYLDGTVFDSSYDRGVPIEFNIGEMIAGWNESLRYLGHGDDAVFIIPSRLGYGKDGYPGFVAPDKILRFDIKVF